MVELLKGQDVAREHLQTSEEINKHFQWKNRQKIGQVMHEAIQVADKYLTRWPALQDQKSIHSTKRSSLWP